MEVADWRLFSDMAITAARAIRAESNSLPQVLGGISPIDPLFMTRMKDQGVLGEVDAVAVLDPQTHHPVAPDPPTRVFEAAGAGACLITDAWEGIELFLEPGQEVLVARDGAEVADHFARLDESEARRMGQRALQRVLTHHTYARRALEVEATLEAKAPQEVAA